MKRRIFAAAATLVLAGCASVPHDSGWLAGKLSVEVRPADAPPRRMASGFELQGDGERGELRLTSPLGSIVATARWAPGEAVLTTSDGSTRYGGLDELSREA
ncbi:lipoprotein insertase outer membrane protein LolB, partial [Rubrivivax gelatinosus]